MAFEDVYTLPSSFLIAGKLRRPALFGFGRRGAAHYGDNARTGGIYQTRMTLRGKVSIKMPFYAPTNPESVPQQANRTKFAAAMSTWMSLTSEQKTAYSQRAKRRGMRASGLFIREYYSLNE